MIKRKETLGLSPTELSILKRLSTPVKIQDFLDTLPINWGDEYMSPRRVLREKKAHCLEGALLATVCLWLNGEKALLLDLKVKGDDDHVVALYKRNGYFGAISKTNHASLRFRDPIYRTIRELALSYFHEYFNNKTKKKVLRSYSSRPFNVKRFGTKWIGAEEDLYFIAEAIDDAPHAMIIPTKNEKLIRKADPVELRAGEIVEWQSDDSRI